MFLFGGSVESDLPFLFFYYISSHMKSFIGLLFAGLLILATSVSYAYDGATTDDELSIELKLNIGNSALDLVADTTINNVGLPAYFIYEVSTYTLPVYSVIYRSANRKLLRDYNSRHS